MEDVSRETCEGWAGLLQPRARANCRPAALNEAKHLGGPAVHILATIHDRFISGPLTAAIPPRIGGA